MKKVALSIHHCLIILILLIACKPKTPPEIAAKSKLPAVILLAQELKVEVRADGLAYLPGNDMPFTGDAIEVHPDRKPELLAKRTPYVNGKKDGVVTSYTPGGRKREERHFKEGKPLFLDVFYINGQKKLTMTLNDKNGGEGPYQRWYDNGVLEAEATFDANEFFHGVEKYYNRKGELIGHYRKEHGILLEVIFEAPEMTKALQEKGLSPPPSVPLIK